MSCLEHAALTEQASGNSLRPILPLAPEVAPAPSFSPAVFYLRKEAPTYYKATADGSCASEPLYAYTVERGSYTNDRNSFTPDNYRLWALEGEARVGSYATSLRCIIHIGLPQYILPQYITPQYSSPLLEDFCRSSCLLPGRTFL